MNTGRRWGAAILLSDGRVLVTGGFSDTIGYLDTTEIYDPALGTWSPTGAMSRMGCLHTATLLADGRVLVSGGAGANGLEATTEIYNPALGTWSPTGAMSRIRVLPYCDSTVQRSRARHRRGECQRVGGNYGDLQSSVGHLVADGRDEHGPPLRIQRPYG